MAAAVAKILVPLVRVMLRYGMSHGAFSDLAKRVYVAVADEERFRVPGRKQTVSRLSILTGLTRKEVRRLRSEELPADADAGERYNRAARVISGWIADPDFAGDGGSPAVLPVDGDVPSFAELVRRYSGDVPPRAIRDELTRVGAIRELDGGALQLETRAYVPAAGEAEKLDILGTDVADLAATIAHNLDAAPGRAFFQRKVQYDNLPANASDLIAPLAARKGQALLEELNDAMAPLDRDTNERVSGSGRKRVLVEVHYYEEDLDLDLDEETEP